MGKFISVLPDPIVDYLSKSLFHTHSVANLIKLESQTVPVRKLDGIIEARPKSQKNAFKFG